MQLVLKNTKENSWAMIILRLYSSLTKTFHLDESFRWVLLGITCEYRI